MENPEAHSDADQRTTKNDSPQYFRKARLLIKATSELVFDVYSFLMLLLAVSLILVVATVHLIELLRKIF